MERRCDGTTANGDQCKRCVKGDSSYCFQHNGYSNGHTNAPKGKKSLYDRLGGIFAIAAVVNRFSDEILKSPLVGIDSPNPQLRDWSRNQPERLPGLKWMRTLWVADITGGPYKFIATRPGSTPLGLENAHKKLKISPEEFDEVARILSETLDEFKIPAKEKKEVLTAFIAHKPEVTMGYMQSL